MQAQVGITLGDGEVVTLHLEACYLIDDSGHAVRVESGMGLLEVDQRLLTTLEAVTIGFDLAVKEGDGVCVGCGVILCDLADELTLQRVDQRFTLGWIRPCHPDLKNIGAEWI